jgi:hypothetical protein
MLVNEYIGYGKNKSGLHWTPVQYHAHADLTWAIDKCRAMKLGWVILIDDGGGSTLQASEFYGGKNIIDMFLERDIVPVIRFFAPANAKFDARMEEAASQLVKKGVHYIFWQNEPEVGSTEWEDRPKNWVEVVTRNYVAGAYKLMNLGAYPGAWATTTFHFPDRDGNIVNPYKVYMTQQERDDIFKNGSGWIAIHPYAKNHPVNYPYDEVNQTGKPLTADEYQAKLQEVDEVYRQTQHLWVWDDYQTSEHHINLVRANGKNPGATIYTDDTCFWMYKGINGYLADLGLLEYVPLLATEAGPVVGERDDGRYARVTPREQIEMIDAELEDIHSVDNFFALGFWLAGVQRLNSVSKDSFEDQSWWTDRHNAPFNLSGEMPIVRHLIESEVKPVVSKSKLAPHVQYLNSEVVSAIGDVKPRVVKVMDPGREQLEAIRAASPGSIIVARVYQANQDYQSDPEGAGIVFANRYANIIDLIDVAEVFNEAVNNTCSAAQCEAFDRYQVAFANRIYELRPEAKVGLFCLPTGNFGYPDEPSLDATWFPRTFSLSPDRTYICLHEYSWYAWDYEAPARMTRYRRQTEWARAMGYRVIITECGFTQAIIIGRPDIGWRSDPSVWSREEYIDALHQYDLQLRQDDYVIGAAVFNCGPSSGWDTFESWSEWQEATEMISEEPEEPEEPEVEEPETNNQAVDYGVVVDHPDVEPGQFYWKCILVKHYPPCENQGRHHVYMDTIDENGNRVNGQTLLVNDIPVVIDKPLSEPGTNSPMWKNTKYYVTVADSIPSSVVLNLHTAHPDEMCEATGTLGNSLYHHSFYLLFKRVKKQSGDGGDGGTEVPGEEEIREMAWNKAGVNYNPEATFQRYARDHGLGNPLPGEVGNEFDWEGCRFQLFTGGIVYAPIDKWGETTHIAW